MSDILSNLNPQTAIILGVTWLVREIFGFISKTLKEFKRTNSSDDVEKLLLKQISHKLDTNTKAVNEMSVSLKMFTQRVENLCSELTKTSD